MQPSRGGACIFFTFTDRIMTLEEAQKLKTGDEIWADVVGYEGCYKASSKGRVKSVDRVVVRSNGANQTVKSRILKQCSGPRGYYMVNLCMHGRCRSFVIHKIVSQAFLGPRKNGYVVDHIDGDRKNNNLENLRYLTTRDNVIYGRHCLYRKNGASKYPGVSKSKGRNKWKASIVISGKFVHLGNFDKEEDAAKAYMEAYKKQERRDLFVIDGEK